MRSSSDTGSGTGRTHRSQAGDKKCDRGHRQKILYIVGIGPGNLAHLTHRATDVLTGVEAVAGYTTYIDLIRPLIEGKQIVSTPMTREVERVQAAVEIAQSGRSCALVSSGDPGIYAMAGLVFEICKKNRIPIKPLSLNVGDTDKDGAIRLEIVPGVPALCAGASVLGAPLTHDFAAISLSDLLTPWETIARRLSAAAEADFVIVLYNPKSKRRNRQLEMAQQIILKYRDADTPVGLVTRAMRQGQQVHIVSLGDLLTVPADMQTTIFIGNRSSATYRDFMYTPRGYAEKYSLDRRDG